jgi:hypothetical protein
MSATRGPFRPGEIAPRSGQCRETGARGGRGREVTVVKGEPLPPPTAPNRIISWWTRRKTSRVGASSVISPAARRARPASG